MIVQSLIRYYDILAREEPAQIAKDGYSQAKVSFALVISMDGKLTNIIDLRSDGKKRTPRSLDVPYQQTRTVGIMPFFACDNAKYIFGIEKLDLKGKSGTSDIVQILEDNGKDKIAVTKRSLECFKKSHEIHHTVLDGVHDSRVQAFLKFFDGW